MKPLRDDRLGGWLAPFVMGSVNTRVVRRSNALRDHAYGRQFRYPRAHAHGRWAARPRKGRRRRGASPACSRASLRRVFVRCSTAFSPDPGEGPDESTRERGFFNIDIHATTSSGKRLRCEIRVQGDPGYKATAVMLGESALCLALDDLPDAAGVLTPASAMGHVLADRLIAAGHSYRVVAE